MLSSQRLMKNILIIIVMSFLSLQTMACVEINEKSVSIKWTAFKTPAKVGVSGLLKNIKFNSKLKGKSLSQIIQSSSFLIKTDKKSIDTKNPARDMKIAQQFFMKLKEKGTINGTVKSYKKNKIIVSFNINGVTKNIPLKTVIKKNQLIASGHIDVLDFMMSDALKSLNKACFAKHEGKTWSDVTLELKAQFNKCQK